MATTAKAKRKTPPRGRSPKRRPAAADRPEGPGVTLVMEGAEQMLDPCGIEPNPWQPRTYFDGEDSKALVAEMKAGRQLQAILVRRAKGGAFAYQLLCGERRCRAARLAGVEVRAQICECSDRDARRIALEENTHRQDLSVIEVARSYQMMLDNGDASGPTELAELLGVAQATVSNRLRLLELPELWQRRVISREITERHARAVLPYVTYPALMEALNEAVDGEIADAGEMPTVGIWESDVIPQVVRSHTRPMTGEVFDSARGRRVLIFEPMGDSPDELDIVEVNGEPRAINVELWDRLQEEFLSAEDETNKADDEADAAESETDPAEDETPCEEDADPDANAEEAEEVVEPEKPSGKDFPSRLWAWKVMALRKAIAGYLLGRSVSLPELARLSALALARWWDFSNNAMLEEALRFAGEKRIKNALSTALAISDYDSYRVLSHLLSQCFWSEDSGPALNASAEDVVAVTGYLDIDVESEWINGTIASQQGYWDLHTKEQLLAIAKEVKLVDYLPVDDDGNPWTLVDLSKKSRGTIIEMCMKAMPAREGDVTGIPMPKEITKAKPPKK